VAPREITLHALVPMNECLGEFHRTLYLEYSGFDSHSWRPRS
jgi:hypothetical protein